MKDGQADSKKMNGTSGREAMVRIFGKSRGGVQGLCGTDRRRESRALKERGNEHARGKGSKKKKGVGA